VTRPEIRRALWALCILAGIWAYATLLTGGFIIDVGEWRLSSRNPINPLMLCIVSGLPAWWLSRKNGRNEGLALWRWCQARIPVVLAAAAAFELVVLFRHVSIGLDPYPLAHPDVFTAVPPLKRFALPLLLAAGIGVLSVAASKASKLVAHPRRTVAAVFLLGLALHLAMIASLRQGFPAFAERAISSGHGDFLHQAVTVEDLGATLENYEPYARQSVYLSGKGPGVLLFFRGLKIVANSAVLRPLLDLVAPSAAAVRPWLTRRGVPPESPHAGQKVEEMRYLLALMFVLFPVLTFLPVFLIFWVGRTFVDETFGLLAAMVYVVTPEASLSIAHLDFALYPLLAIGTVAPFVIGVRQQRLRYVAASAVVFMLFFVTTLAAVSAVAMLMAYLGCDAWQRIRRRDTPVIVTSDVARVLGVFGLVCGLALTSLYFAIDFHPIERYSYAHEVQRNWITSTYDLFWVVENTLGYFLSFGLVQTALLIVQLGRSALRVLAATADGIALLAVAWLCLLLALLAFGRQHGETNRLWAFLSPVGCLIVARYIYDVIPSRRWWLPMLLFFVSLVLMRYRLSYF
jgi:hypothetical protein